MAYALQQNLRPRPLWIIRTLTFGGVVILVLILGIFNRARHPAPELVLSGPHDELAYARRVERLIASAQHRIWMLMFVVRLEKDELGPVSDLMHALASAAARGVHVQVCLDAGNDWQTHAPDNKHLEALSWLQAHGITAIVDEIDRTSHAKALIVDDEWVVVGSHNWTRTALTGNREASVVLCDGEVAQQLKNLLIAIPGWDKNY